MFANDDYQLADPGSLRLQWLWHNLTMDQSAKVSVSLYGYRESTNTPELVYIDTLMVSDGVETAGASLPPRCSDSAIEKMPVIFLTLHTLNQMSLA